MDRAKKDPVVGPKIAKSGIVIQFRYSDPEAVTTVNAKDKPTQAGAFCDVIHGPCSLKPDVIMTMKADTSHAFWHGKVNLMAAIAKKDIVTQGPLPKILKLLPAVTPLYKVYPVLL
jgi:putative sterol carrier protein